MKKVFKFLFIIILVIGMIFLLKHTALAAGNCAFSVGAEYSDIDTRDAALYAQERYSGMGYNSYYSTVPNYSILGGYFQNGTRRLESDIVFLDGHANNHSIVFPGCGLQIGGKDGGFYWGTDNFNWRNVKLAVLAGCETAQYGDSIAYRINWGGATTSVGFIKSASTVAFTQWTKRFNLSLANGKTVNEAKDYANSFIYLDNRIKSVQVIGNGNLILSNSTRNMMNLNEEVVRALVISSKESLNIESQETITKVEEEIKNNNKLFNSNDYVYEINKTSNDKEEYTIDFIYKIGDFETNSGYTAFIKAGKLVKILDNTINIENINKRESFFNNVYQAQKESYEKLAKEEVKRKMNNIEIVETKTKFYYDIKSNKKYIVIMVINQYKDAKSIEEVKYEL